MEPMLFDVPRDAKRDEFLGRVVDAFIENKENFPFIPFPRLFRDYGRNRFIRDENGFIFIGSVFARVTPIHAVYIYPEKRNGSTDKVIGLLKKLPRKKYRVRCHFGKAFWLRCGLKEVSVESKNTRKRNVYTLEGFLGVTQCSSL